MTVKTQLLDFETGVKRFIFSIYLCTNKNRLKADIAFRVKSRTGDMRFVVVVCWLWGQVFSSTEKQHIWRFFTVENTIWVAKESRFCMGPGKIRRQICHVMSVIFQKYVFAQSVIFYSEFRPIRKGLNIKKFRQFISKMNILLYNLCSSINIE